jgi:hypothetical protein
MSEAAFTFLRCGRSVKCISILSLCAAFAVLACTSPAAFAQEIRPSVYDQEGTTYDGYPGINAAGQGPSLDPDNSWMNWKYQYGGRSWTGVYGPAGWASRDGPAASGTRIEVECDLELYFSQEFERTIIYFHLGNPFTATEADKTAHVLGKFTSNNGQYIGLSFWGTNKDQNNMEQIGGHFTGRIFDAMDGTIDVKGRDISNESFDIEILLDWGMGYTRPDYYGDGADGTIADGLWWLVNFGEPGIYNLDWQIRILPDAAQADGNYHLDPIVVAAPSL